MQGTINDIIAHAKKEYPRESCGLVIVFKGKEKYIPCKNIASITSDNFVIDPVDYAKAEDMGEIIKIIHSHVHAPPEPSEADLIACEKTNKIWGIVSIPSEEYKEFSPSGYIAPLVGRQFCHGLVDCYTLIRDYYKLELNIDLPDFERKDNWWHNGENLYLDNFEKAGFIRVEEPLQKHDVIFMQLLSKVPNHAAIYLGDDIILHHVYDRLSSKDVYGGYWRKNTWCIVRRKEFCH